jgi:tungstate transport system substrate-binding protein
VVSPELLSALGLSIRKEMELWKKADIKPAGPWYVTYEKGAEGNAPTTRHADLRQAYILMDRAT